MIRSLYRLLPLLLLCLAACSAPPRTPPAAVPTAGYTPPDPAIEVTILQMNDVYEITPVEGGESGGLARVATLRKRLLEENPNTLTVMAGDFFSPSALGTARVDGERLAGAQMVAVLNALGLDVATFGNHEFDIDREAFYQRLGESRFQYVASNVFDAQGRSFPGTAAHLIWKIPGPRGDTLRLGLVTATIDSNPVEYVRYAPPVERMRAEIERMRGRTDAVIALTHLALEDDIALADSIPALHLIMGGHEHENYQLWRGTTLTPITKADANARTVYVHRLRYDPATRALTVRSNLERITDAIPDDPAVAAEVERWVDAAFAGFRAQGLKPAQPVVTLPVPLDGREASVRNRPTNLTDLIAEAMYRAAGAPDLAVFNSGSIRIDDVLPPGTLVEYDVIRVLPFGGDVLTVTMPGSVLDSVLTIGAGPNQGSGGFLQHHGVTRTAGGWQIQDRPLDPARTYRVAISDFLVTGLEKNLGFLTLDDPRIAQVATHGDVRLAVVAELKRRYE